MATPAAKKDYKLPVVVIVGRANVGKSSLFNRFLEEKKAMVSDVAGTTRTNNEGDVLWRGTYIRVIDTGGPDNAENEPFAKDIIAQSKAALAQADVIVMVCDAESGILPQERELARQLRQTATKNKSALILAANKCDNQRLEANTRDHEWLSLGLGSALCVSASNGRGVGDLLDAIYNHLKKQRKTPKGKKAAANATEIRVCLLGKPNVGKSSLFNKLIGEEKVIVSDIAHTTREPFDTELVYEQDNKKYQITFVDTAGIRRKSRVAGHLEREGISRSVEAMNRSDIILLVLDASESLATQDLQLGGMIEQHSRGVIIILNKWDLVDDNSDLARNKMKTFIYNTFPHLDFAPIVFVSSKTGYRAHQIFPEIIAVDNARKTVLEQPQINEFLYQTTHEHRPARGKGTRHPEIVAMRQLDSAPPVFEIFIKYRTSLHASYLNFLKRKLREEFGFIGTPIIIKMSKMKR